MLTREQQSLLAIPFRRRFHVRLTLWYGGAIFLVLAIMGTVVYRFGLNSELDALRDRLKFTVVALAATLDAESLVNLDSADDVEDPAYRAVVSRLDRLTQMEPGVGNIYIMRPTGRPNELAFVIDYATTPGIATPGVLYDASQVPALVQGLEAPVSEEEPVGDRYGLTISGYAPLRFADGRPFGVVGLDMNASRVDAIKREVMWLTFGLFGLAGVLLVGLAVLVGRMVRRPLAHMMNASTRIAAGDFAVRLDLPGGDEFAQLGENFNQMAEGLREREFIRDTLGRYVSRDVARVVLTTPGMVDLGGEERDVTVLLSDIRGYSTISENMQPAQVVDLLNQYFGAMNQVIDAHQGCVIEYLGDGILVVFGAPNPLPGHPGKAIQCALAMRQRLAELHTEWEASGLAKLWRARGLDSLKVRVGIHTGSVVAGNLGSRERMKYSVTGDTVNVAARLEQLNKTVETELLFSTATWERLPDSMRRRAIDKGSHHVKGRASEVRVYTMDLDAKPESLEGESPSADNGQAQSPEP